MPTRYVFSSDLGRGSLLLGNRMPHRMWKLGIAVVALAMVVALGTTGRAEAFEQTEYVTSPHCPDGPGNYNAVIVVEVEGVGVLEIEWREVNEPTFHVHREASVHSTYRNIIDLVLREESQIVYRAKAHDLRAGDGSVVLREGFLIRHSSYCK
jgi:hypothetical protein